MIAQNYCAADRRQTGGDNTKATPVVSPHHKLKTNRSIGAGTTAPSVGYQENDSAFTFLLYDILEDAARLGFDNVISWVQGGKAFKIHNRERLAAYVLPNYFARSSSQYRSFHRQLNLYNFSRGDHEERTSTRQRGPSDGGKKQS
jgi:hypothetical protein